MKSFIRIFSLVLVASIFTSNIASAQFTLTNSSLERFFNTDFDYTIALSYDGENIIQLMEQKGADQSWDFTTLEYEFTTSGEGVTEMFSSAAGTPGAGDDHLEQATHVLRSALTIRAIDDGEEVDVELVQYEYAIIDDEEFRVIGTMVMSTDESGDTDLQVLSVPGEKYYTFPATYQSSWTTQFEERVITGVFDTMLDYTVDVEIDGWGEIVTPDGTFEVLRVSRLRQLNLGAFVIESLEVDFVNEFGIPIASLSAEIDPVTGELDAEDAEAALNVFTLPPMTTSSEPAIADLPVDVTLHQNYPNPFNPSTQISFEIPEASHVRLDVFDMSGRRVASLVDEGRSAGRHTVNFDASGLSSGIYMSRLQAGAHTVTGRMTLVK